MNDNRPTSPAKDDPTQRTDTITRTHTDITSLTVTAPISHDRERLRSGVRRYSELGI